MIIRVKGSSPKIIILPSSKYFGGITIEIENNKIISSLSTIFGKEDNTENAVFRTSTNNLPFVFWFRLGFRHSPVVVVVLLTRK